jgi:hypothetical protein
MLDLVSGGCAPEPLRNSRTIWSRGIKLGNIAYKYSLQARARNVIQLIVFCATRDALQNLLTGMVCKILLKHQQPLRNPVDMDGAWLARCSGGIPGSGARSATALGDLGDRHPEFISVRARSRLSFLR